MLALAFTSSMLTLHRAPMARRAVRSVVTAARPSAMAAVRMSQLPPVSAPDGFVAPEPKALTVPEGQLLSALTGAVALAFRFGTGVFVQGWTPGIGSSPGKYSLYNFRDTSSTLAACARPTVPLRLYEYEPSPYCRKVRPFVRLPHVCIRYSHRAARAAAHPSAVLARHLPTLTVCRVGPRTGA